MALKQAYAVKTVIGNTDLELEADVGESFRIKDVFILNPASSYVTFKTEKTTVGYFRVDGDLGSHLPFPKSPTKHSVGFNAQAYAMTSVEYNSVIDAGGNVLDMLFSAETDLAAPAVTPRMSSPQQILPNPWTILRLLSSMGKFTGYPVATGETFKITGAAQATAMQVVIYEIMDGEDVKNTEDNGSKAKNYLFVNYGRTAASVTTAVSTIYDTPQSPAEFPAFPFNRTVPPKTTIDLLGILGSEITISGATVAAYIYSQYLKLVFERETLFDEDRNGIPHLGLTPPDVATLVSIAEGSSLIGNYSTVDAKMPLMFDTPLTFGEGDELGIYLTTALAGAGGTITAARSEIATIEMVRRAE
jgi:hypothetical protein